LADEMKLRKSRSQQLLKLVESLEPMVSSRLGGVVDALEPEGATRLRPNVRRATYAAGGLALLTAASAGISSLRDRLEG
jgi:hypothetical protein